MSSISRGETPLSRGSGTSERLPETPEGGGEGGGGFNGGGLTSAVSKEVGKALDDAFSFTTYRGADMEEEGEDDGEDEDDEEGGGGGGAAAAAAKELKARGPADKKKKDKSNHNQMPC